MGFFSDDNNSNELVWDIIKTVPGVGQVVSGVNVAQDVYTIATEDGEEEAQGYRDLAQDALGFSPIGNAIGLASVGYDIMAPNDNAHDMMDRLMGGPGGNIYDPACDGEVGGRYNMGEGAQCYPDEPAEAAPLEDELSEEDMEYYQQYSE